MIIDLTEPERALLATMLAEAHKKAIHELNHTDTLDFKAVLRRRLEVLDSLQGKVAAAKAMIAE
jgi:hypothetical protein